MTRAHKVRTATGGMWRRKKAFADDEHNMVDLVDNTEDTKDKSASAASLLDDAKELSSTDAFQKEVAKKTQTMLIGRKEAELEVFTDIVIDKLENVDNALLYVVSTMKSETKAQILVNNLISRGANTSTSDSKLKTPLHFAVEKKFKGVAAKLLEHHALPHARDRDKLLPLRIAFDTGQDEMCALLLSYMPNTFVRQLFLGNGERKAEFSLHELLRGNLQKTVLSVLDCLIESDGSGDNIQVFYNILEADEHGRPPDDSKFEPKDKSPLQIIAKQGNKNIVGQLYFDERSWSSDDSKFEPKDKSPLQIIAKQGNKNIVYHDSVRLLIRRKWKHYAKQRFEFVSILYLLTLFCLTYSGVIAVMAPDPLVYDTALQISRAVFEVLSVSMALQLLISELNQFKRHRLEYFTDAFNWFDLSSSVLILTVIPLRFIQHNAQWHVFAFGYLFWVIRIFKYAAVFRQTGAYAQVLFKILGHDFIQFGVVFLVILLAFSGAFFLSLRGDNDLNTHNETSTFLGIVFVGVRTLTEAQPVVEYTGEDGYGTVSVILMSCFLLTCYVILLNILIAQLTDTYQNVQQDAQRGLEVNRAWIIARMELNTLFFGQNFRKKFYAESEEIRDLKNVLTKWDSPPINEMNKYIRDIWDSLDNQNLNILTVQHRLARQENALRSIQEGLDRLIELQRTQLSNESPISPTHVAFTLNTNSESGISVASDQQGGDDVNANDQTNSNNSQHTYKSIVNIAKDS